MVIIWIAVGLMIVSRALWAWHDLYFWGKAWVKALVLKIGWHNIKMAFMITFWGSAFFTGFHEGRHYEAMTWLYAWHLCKLLFAIALIAWGAFEGMYNTLQRDARLFDWARYLRAAIMGKAFRDMPMDYRSQLKTGNRFEFIFHHCFRLHIIEAIVVIIGGILMPIFWL